MEKILTFSIAAYNVEQYLDNTIQSILNADRNQDIEVLIVNDGSKDKTRKIGREWENKYPDTIRLIDKENGGHGSTINIGMSQAKGKYFRALDGDDWVNSKDLTTLVDKLKDSNADVVISNYDECYEDGKIIHKRFEQLKDEQQGSFETMINNTGYITYHTIIYKTSILKEHQILLDENCFYVDTEYVLLPMPFVETIQYYDLVIYCYRLGVAGQSVSPQSRMKHKDNSEKVMNRLLSFYEKQKNIVSLKKKTYILNGCARHAIWHFMTLLHFQNGKEELRNFEKTLKNKEPEIYKEMPTATSSTIRKLVITSLRKTQYFLFGSFRKLLLSRY